LSNEVQLDGTAVSMLRWMYGCKLKERQKKCRDYENCCWDGSCQFGYKSRL